VKLTEDNEKQFEGLRIVVDGGFRLNLGGSFICGVQERTQRPQIPPTHVGGIRGGGSFRPCRLSMNDPPTRWWDWAFPLCVTAFLSSPPGQKEWTNATDFEPRCLPNSNLTILLFPATGRDGSMATTSPIKHKSPVPAPTETCLALPISVIGN